VQQHSQVGGHVDGTVVTGATGFVGGELVVKLLRRSARNLILPIRATSDEAAAARGHDTLTTLMGDDVDLYRDRVLWLRGDIEEPQLGWNDMQWHTVAAKTNEIYHCAASVSFDLPLGQANRINLVGTKHVFALAVAAAARHTNFRRFHHVSTAYVAGVRKGRVDSDYLPSDRASNFRNTYEHTKARAERFLRAEASSKVPVSIHRPSIIAGDSKTGRTTNWNVLYVPMKMVARGALPAFTRAGRQLVDAVAVDFLVDAMMTFSVLDSAPVESHHLTAGRSAFTVTDVIRSTSEHAGLLKSYKPSQTKLCGPVTWKGLTAAIAILARLPRQAGSIRTKARIAQRCIDQCAVYLPYARVNTIFDATHDHDVLRVFGVEMPHGQDYLDTIRSYALATNFGKTAALPTVTSAP